MKRGAVKVPFGITNDEGGVLGFVGFERGRVVPSVGQGLIPHPTFAVDWRRPRGSFPPRRIFEARSLLRGIFSPPSATYARGHHVCARVDRKRGTYEVASGSGRHCIR